MFRAFRYVADRLPAAAAAAAAFCIYRLRVFGHEIMRTCCVCWVHQWHKKRNTYWELEYSDTSANE